MSEFKKEIEKMHTYWAEGDEVHKDLDFLQVLHDQEIEQARAGAIDEVKQELIDKGFIWTEHALEVWNGISDKLKNQEEAQE